MPNAMLYGFTEFEDLMNRRIADVGVDVVMTAVEQSVAEYVRQLNMLLGLFVERTTDYTLRYKQAGKGTLQPLDETGNPRPIREEGYYDVAFPIQGGGTAWGDTRISRAKMTVAEANELTLNSTKRDADWMRRHILASVFDNVAWTFADLEHGNLTVQPLANDDAVEYVNIDGDSATDNHYLYQAAAIGDAANPFGTIYDELMEHAGASGPLVCYVATNLTDAIEGLTAFTEVGDPDLRYGVNTDLVGKAMTPRMGHEVLGKVNKCWIVEWRVMPDGYILAHAEGAGPPVAQREHGEAELQGLFTELHNVDGNLKSTRMLRYAGFGVKRRTAACVMVIGEEAYAIPDGYNAPLGI